VPSWSKSFAHAEVTAAASSPPRTLAKSASAWTMPLERKKFAETVAEKASELP
jgi:hypothetical protein